MILSLVEQSDQDHNKKNNAMTEENSMIYKKNLQKEESRNTNYAKSRVVVRLG